MKISQRLFIYLILWFITLLVAYGVGQRQKEFQDYALFARKAGYECFKKLTQ